MEEDTFGIIDAVFTDDKATCIRHIPVNEGFAEYRDQIFVLANPNILNCNKGDEQNTKFYFKQGE